MICFMAISVGVLAVLAAIAAQRPAIPTSSAGCTPTRRINLDHE